MGRSSPVIMWKSYSLKAICIFVIKLITKWLNIADMTITVHPLCNIATNDEICCFFLKISLFYS